MKPKRFTRNAWLDFGLNQLATEGPDALKLTNLCAAAGKTIGSFYHHFKDQSAYFEALLAYWKDKNTLDVIKHLSAAPEAEDKAKQLEIIASAMDRTQDVGIRALAQQNAMAAAVVAEVDLVRISFLQMLYRDQFQLDEEEAKRLAQLEYAAFVGSQTIWPKGSVEHGQSLSALFQKLVQGTYGPGRAGP